MPTTSLGPATMATVGAAERYNVRYVQNPASLSGGVLSRRPQMWRWGSGGRVAVVPCHRPR